ncbi:trypsin alpha-3-like [Paramacrobiotus metropolitanus]|uniref:trypsin alpha-3-like n=1 Tax=Paramacrobiotus metropolitanus TaxID=2943436 RepID=UPI002445FB52|nr:trypsin alpha-3-like [Paramacrobiotus metropolitanus]
MNIFVIVAAFFIGAAYTKPAPPKIVGGDHVVKGDHPYQIHLRRTINYFGIFQSTSWGCGGSIISANYVLTAAHCVKDFDGRTDLAAANLLIRVGQHDSSEQESHAENYRVRRVISHNGFNPSTLVHDVALLEVDPITFTDHAQAVPLAAIRPSTGAELTVTGWGTTSSGGSASEILQSVNVHVVDRATCNGPSSYAGAIVDGMLCAAANGKDSCQGDSGGPLTATDANGQDSLVGVVSWGRGCAFDGYPGVYADVVYYLPWIQQNSGVVPAPSAGARL